MACEIITLSGVALDCPSSLGGLQALYVCPTEFVTGITISASTEGDIISNIKLSGLNKFKEYSFRKGNANFSSEGNVDDKNGTFFVNTTLTCQLNRMDKFNRKEMVLMTKQPSYVIAKDRNGKSFFIGYGSQCIGSAAAASGAERGDLNGYTLTITSETSEYPIVVKDSIIAGIIA